MVCIYAKKRNKRHASINLQELIDRYSSGEYIVQNFKFMKEEFLLSLNRNQTLILVSVIEKKMEYREFTISSCCIRILSYPLDFKRKI